MDRFGTSSWTRLIRAREHALFLLFVSPNILLLLVFTYRPLYETIELSLFQWDLISPDKRWVGLDNYRTYFSDSTNRYVIRNTLVFTMATVVGTMAFGLAFAMMLNQKLRGRNLARGVLFAPYVMSGAAVGIVWLFMFDPRFGLVASVL